MRKDREETMLTHLDSLLIDRALLMALNEKESEDNLLLASRHKGRLFAAVSPLETETGDLDLFLYRAREKGAAAVGELVVNKRIDSSYVSRIFALAQELRLPVTFHLSPEEGFSYGIVDDIHLPLLEKALKAFPSHALSDTVSVSGLRSQMMSLCQLKAAAAGAAVLSGRKAAFLT